jgi:methyl-accepting chemotaxis protein
MFNKIENITSNSVSKIIKTNEISFLTVNLHAIVRDTMIDNDNERRKKYYKLIEEDVDKVKININNLNLISSPEEKVYISKYMNEFNGWYSAVLQILALRKENRFDEARDMLINLCIPTRLRSIEKLEDLEKFLQNQIYNETKIIKDNYKNSTNLMISLSLLFIFISTFIFLLVLYKFKLKFSSIISQLKLKSKNIFEISKDISISSSSLKDLTTEQASNIIETSASINEISSMLNKTNESSNISKKLSEATSKSTDDSKITIDELVKAMNVIQSSNNDLQNISLIINEIESKASLINDIVSKTELLSLNASIESARAGEYGKGFAVVAEEVGNLAKISGKSANEIQQLINKSQEQVTKILELSKENTEEGKKVTTKVQTSFLEVANNIDNISSSIEQIDEATNEQKVVINQIVAAVEGINNAVQKNLISITKNAESCNLLLQEGENINEIVNNIIYTINGDK